MMMNDVVIFDKQDITYIGIDTLIRKIKGVDTVHRVDTKKELVKLLISYPSATIVLDYTLSDFLSADDLLNLGYRFPQSKWLLFSEELSNDFLRRVLFSSESFSVVLKSCELNEINTALSHLVRNERFICGRISIQLIEMQKTPQDTLDHILTPTEKEILKEIALGKTTKEIAAKRNLSIHTVMTHRKNVFRKLEVNNIHEATKYAIRAGLIDLAEYYI